MSTHTNPKSSSEEEERKTNLVYNIHLGQCQIFKTLQIKFLSKRARFELSIMECQSYHHQSTMSLYYICVVREEEETDLDWDTNQVDRSHS